MRKRGFCDCKVTAKFSLLQIFFRLFCGFYGVRGGLVFFEVLFQAGLLRLEEVHDIFGALGARVYFGEEVLTLLGHYSHVCVSSVGGDGAVNGEHCIEHALLLVGREVRGGEAQSLIFAVKVKGEVLELLGGLVGHF